MIVLLYKAYLILEEKVEKCVDFWRYFDYFVVFEMFRGKCIDPYSIKAADCYLMF